MEGNLMKGIAQAFVQARSESRPLSAYPGVRPETLEEGYAIQDEAIGLAKGAIVGWKVGRIIAPLDARFGANRLAGPVIGDTVREFTGNPVEMPVFAGGFAAAEAEFMLRLGDGPFAEIPADDSGTLDLIDEIRIGIEVASSPYAGINADGPCVTISDFGNNAGLVLGMDVPRNLWGTLDTIVVETRLDGAVVGTATTATMLDGPLGAVRFLLGNLKARGITPAPGTWISSGAITGVHDVRPGQVAEAEFAGLGTVSVRFI